MLGYDPNPGGWRSDPEPAIQFYFNRMEQTHERLVRRAPQHPGMHHYIGETFGILKLPERAIASYERAARSPGAGPPTWMELASIGRWKHYEQLLAPALETLDPFVQAFGYAR